MRKRLLTMLAVLALFPLAMPAGAHTQNFTYDGPKPTCVYIDVNSSAGYSTSQWNPLNKAQTSVDAINAAINVINARPSTYSFQYCGLSNTTDYYHKVVLKYDWTIPDLGALAVADQLRSGPNLEIGSGALIRFNDSVTWDTCPCQSWWRIGPHYTKGSSAYSWIDFQYALTHELLHVLGAPHVTNAGHTMLASGKTFRSSIQGRTLEQHDVDYIDTK